MVIQQNYEKVWTEKSLYSDAERRYYENLSRGPLTPLADKVAKARQRLIEIKDTYNKDGNTNPNATTIVQALEAQVLDLKKTIFSLLASVDSLESRINMLEQKSLNIVKDSVEPIKLPKEPVVKGDDDDLDLFDSDSDNEAAEEIKQARVAAYNQKKSKKPALIAKSNIILDVKPWDDETDMKAMEAEIRKIVADGLLLGASKLVPLAYGIFKLQISCVIEDDKISVDWLQEQIEGIEDFVQSCDIAAFNKI